MQRRDSVGGSSSRSSSSRRSSVGSSSAASLPPKLGKTSQTVSTSSRPVSSTLPPSSSFTQTPQPTSSSSSQSLPFQINCLASINTIPKKIPIRTVLPGLMEVMPNLRPGLFIAKLRQCSSYSKVSSTSYQSSQEDEEMRKQKQEILYQLLEFVNASGNIFYDVVLPDFFTMVSANLFRATVKPVCEGGIYDPDEDEPSTDPQWNMLQFVYELLLRFTIGVAANSLAGKHLCTGADSTGAIDIGNAHHALQLHMQTSHAINLNQFSICAVLGIHVAEVQKMHQEMLRLAPRFIAVDFVLKILQLFGCNDPRERDYLKTILHRIYANFMGLRAFIRSAIRSELLNFTNGSQRHNGISELLEIMGSIINGFTIPLKDEHIFFLSEILMPMHKVQFITTIHTQLTYCVCKFVEKDPTLAQGVIAGIISYWPRLNSHKEVTFLAELEGLLETTPFEVLLLQNEDIKEYSQAHVISKEQIFQSSNSSIGIGNGNIMPNSLGAIKNAKTLFKKQQLASILLAVSQATSAGITQGELRLASEGPSGVNGTPNLPIQGSSSITSSQTGLSTGNLSIDAGELNKIILQQFAPLSCYSMIWSHLAQCICSSHFMVAEKACTMLLNQRIVDHIKYSYKIYEKQLRTVAVLGNQYSQNFMRAVYAAAKMYNVAYLLARSLTINVRSHWNSNIKTSSESTLKQLHLIDPKTCKSIEQDFIKEIVVHHASENECERRWNCIANAALTNIQTANAKRGGSNLSNQILKSMDIKKTNINNKRRSSSLISGSIYDVAENQVHTVIDNFIIEEDENSVASNVEYLTTDTTAKECICTPIFISPTNLFHGYNICYVNSNTGPANSGFVSCGYDQLKFDKTEDSNNSTQESRNLGICYSSTSAYEKHLLEITQKSKDTFTIYNGYIPGYNTEHITPDSVSLATVPNDPLAVRVDISGKSSYGLNNKILDSVIQDLHGERSTGKYSLAKILTDGNVNNIAQEIANAVAHDPTLSSLAPMEEMRMSINAASAQYTKNMRKKSIIPLTTSQMESKVELRNYKPLSIPSDKKY